MKKIIITIIFAILLGACGSGLIENSRLNVSKAEGFENDKTLDKSDICDVINYSVNGDRFCQIGDDPGFYVVNFYMKIESLKIVLSEPLEKNTLVELYYDNLCSVKYGHKGDTEIYIDTDEANACSAIRVDINGDFSLEHIELSKSDFDIVQVGKSEISIWAYIVAWILAIAIAVGVVYGYNITEKTEAKLSKLKKRDSRLFDDKKNIYKLIVAITYIASILGILLLINNEYVKLTAVTLATIVFAVLFNLFSIYKNIAGIVFAAIMMSGICYVFTLPVASLISFDDEFHYENSVKFSHAFENSVTEADEFIYGRLVTEKYNQSTISYSMEELERLYDIGAVSKDGGVTTDPYKTLSYIPSGTAMFIARGLGCSFAEVFYAGKLGNLLVYALLIYLAIRRLSSGKLILAVVALLPTNIFLAASYTYDIWLTGFSMFGIAYIAGVIQDKAKGIQIKIKDIIIILASLTIGFAPKAVYFPLLLLVFLIPKDSFKNKKTYKKMCIFTCLCILFVLMTFMLPFVMEGPGEGDLRGGEDVNSIGQVSFILNNPIEYTKILLKHIKVYISPENQMGTIGTLGYMGDTTHFILLMLILAMVTFADRDSTGIITNNWKSRIWAAFSIFASIVLVSTALYISFTPVGNSMVNGCQYRYLIPLIFPLLYFVFNIKTDSRNINKSLFAAICVCSVIFILYSDAWKLWIRLYR